MLVKKSTGFSITGNGYRFRRIQAAIEAARIELSSKSIHDVENAIHIVKSLIKERQKNTTP